MSRSVTFGADAYGTTYAKANYNRSPPAGYNPSAAKAVVAHQIAQSPLPGYSRNAQLHHAMAYQQVLSGMQGLSLKGGRKRRRRTQNYKSMMNRLMKTRVHRYAARLPGIAENDESNNYVNYANNFEAPTPNNNYANNFHPETEAEEYAALKVIMAEPLTPSAASEIPNGLVGMRPTTPAPQRGISAGAAGAGPSGPSSFKPSIGSAFGAFKKRGGGSKNLTKRRRHRKGTHRNGLQ
jgi:hypothetical protein